jgi:hypothetical protein
MRLLRLLLVSSVTCATICEWGSAASAASGRDFPNVGMAYRASVISIPYGPVKIDSHFAAFDLLSEVDAGERKFTNNNTKAAGHKGLIAVEAVSNLMSQTGFIGRARCQVQERIVFKGWCLAEVLNLDDYRDLFAKTLIIDFAHPNVGPKLSPCGILGNVSLALGLPQNFTCASAREIGFSERSSQQHNADGGHYKQPERPFGHVFLGYKIAFGAFLVAFGFYLSRISLRHNLGLLLFLFGGAVGALGFAVMIV